MGYLLLGKSMAMARLHDGVRVGVMVTTVLLFGLAKADSNAKDKEECTQQLVGLATCLPYVGGDAKAPTPDCCSGLKQLLKNDKKCLCLIIKDRNDPELGLKINVTIAMGLPSVCHAPANVSQCPALLHLPPNSPDAQVFYQFGNGNKSSSGPAASPSPGPVQGMRQETNSGGPRSSAEQQSNGCPLNRQRWLGWEIICLGIFLRQWHFVY